jgi:hypothetical protein
MHITEYYQKPPLHVLIDCGSTHNFLEVNMAKKIGCKIDPIDLIIVAIADGARVLISSVVQNFQWTIQHQTFTFDMF